MTINYNIINNNAGRSSGGDGGPRRRRHRGTVVGRVGVGRSCRGVEVAPPGC